MMRPDNLKVIGQILSPLRRSQSKTITLVIQGIAWMAQAASIPVATFVSQATGSQINSALTRFYREAVVCHFIGGVPESTALE